MIGALREELTLVDPAARTAPELLRLMADRALRAGHVRDSFADAVVAREARFPTGLPTSVPAAVPHTDAGHVVRPGIVVALLGSPVHFVEMASTDRVVPARLVLMLLVRDPGEQVETLGSVIAALQDPGLAGRLDGVRSPDDLIRALQQPIDPGLLPTA